MGEGIEARPARWRRARAPRRPKLELSLGTRGLALLALGLGLALAGSFFLGRSTSSPAAVEPGVVFEDQARAPLVLPPLAGAPREDVAPAPRAAAEPAPAAAAAAAPEPAPEPAPAPAPAPRLEVESRAPSSGYGLQLGAFETEEEAAAFLEAHAEALRGLPVFVIATVIPERGTWHRVRAGAVKQRADAEALKRKLPAELGKISLVVSHR